MSLGERLKLARGEYPADKLGQRLGLKNGMAVRLWENGRRSPSVKNLAALCRELKVSADWLLEVDVTLLDRARFESLKRQVQRVRMLNGCLAEVGVYQGGSAELLCMDGNNVHLYDTFEGMPQEGPNDVHKKGDFSDTSLEVVQKKLERYAHVKYHKGLFPATFTEKGEPFKLVHLDGDLYQTTKDGLEIFWWLMVQGGMIVLDDWKWPRCPGVQQAVMEFLPGKNVILIEEAKYQLIMVKA